MPKLTNLNDQKKQEYAQKGLMTSNYFNKIDSLAVAGWAEYQAMKTSSVCG